MSGNKEGGQKTVKTIYKRYGKDYFSKLGKKGGKHTSERYFAFLKRTDPDKLYDISRRKRHKKT